MEIVLSKKQVDLIQSGINELESLRQQVEIEGAKIQKRVDAVVEAILDFHGVAPVQGMRFAEGKLIIPEPEKMEEKIEFVEKRKK